MKALRIIWMLGTVVSLLGCWRPSPTEPKISAPQSPRVAETRIDPVFAMRSWGAKLIHSEAGAVRYVVMTDLPVGNDALKPLEELADVEVLSLSGTRVTDEGMTHLTGLKRLSYLFLNDTAISNQGLLALADSPQLRYVSLQNTTVTESAIEEFRRQSPGTLVHHSPPGRTYRNRFPSGNAPSLPGGGGEFDDALPAEMQEDLARSGARGGPISQAKDSQIILQYQTSDPPR